VNTKSVSGQVDPTASVHPSARVDERARIGPGAVVEAEAVVGPHCIVGAGTRLRTRSILVERVTLGERNDVHPYAVLGGDPQDRSFKPEHPGEVIVGDRNVIREGVTVNRANWNGGPTRIGDDCYLMCQSHLGHNARIGNRVMLANCACLAGHSVVGDGCVLSSFVGIHQFCEVGEGVMIQGRGATSMHVPPFVMLSSIENNIAGLNSIGLRRNPSITAQDRSDIKRVYTAFFRTRGARPYASVIEELLQDGPLAPAATRFIEFVQRVTALEKPRNRGLCGVRVSRGRRTADQSADAAMV